MLYEPKQSLAERAYCVYRKCNVYSNEFMTNSANLEFSKFYIRRQYEFEIKMGISTKNTIELYCRICRLSRENSRQANQWYRLGQEARALFEQFKELNI